MSFLDAPNPSSPSRITANMSSFFSPYSTDAFADFDSVCAESSDFAVAYAARTPVLSNDDVPFVFDVIASRLQPRKAQTWGESTETVLMTDEMDAEDDESEDMISTYPPTRRILIPEPSPLAHFSDATDSAFSSPFSAISKSTASTASTATCTPNSPNDSSEHSPSSLSSSPYLASALSFASAQNHSDLAAHVNHAHPTRSLEHSQSHGVERSSSAYPAHLLHTNSTPLHSLEHAFAQALPSPTPTSGTPHATLANSPHAQSASHPLYGSSFFGTTNATAAGPQPSMNNATMPIPSSSIEMPSMMVLTHSTAANVSGSTASPPKRANGTTAIPLVTPSRPASVGPLKVTHRRHKSGKRVPPPPFSSELLKAVRLRLDRLPGGDTPSSSELASVGHPSLASLSAASSSAGSALPFSTKQYYHSRGSSTSSGSASASSFGSGDSIFGGSHSSSYDSLSSLGAASSPRHDYTLPHEVWERVFRFLTPGDILDMHTVSLSWTCTSWDEVRELDLTSRHELGFAGTTWIKHIPSMTRLTKLTLNAFVPTDTALASIALIPSIEWLGLHCHPYDTSEVGLQHLAQLPNLKQVALWVPQNIRPNVLTNLLPRLPHLQHFKVETLRPFFTEVAFKHIETMTGLRTLDLSWCKRLSTTTFANLAKLSALETLVLDMCGSDVAISGLSQLRTLPHLTTLSLRWCDQLTDAMLPNLATFRALKTLDVSYCQYVTTTAITAHLPKAQVIRNTPPPE